MSRLLIVLAGVATVALIGLRWIRVGGGPRASRVATADWFVLDPSARWVALGDRHGRVRFLELGTETAPSPPTEGPREVVFTASGSAVLVDPTVAADPRLWLWTWDSDVGARAIATPTVADWTLHPAVEGGKRSGAVEAGAPLVLVAGDASGGRELWILRGLTERTPTIERVAVPGAVPPYDWVSSHGGLVAVGTGGAGVEGGSGRLWQWDLSGEPTVVDDVAAGRPVWLADEDALLYEREGAGICALPLDGREPVWIGEGGLASTADAAEVSWRRGTPFRLIERLGRDGEVGIDRLWPIETRRRERFSSGSAHHYGLQVTTNSEFVIYRQRPGDRSLTSSDTEELIVVSLGAGGRSHRLDERRARASDAAIGPVYRAAADSVFWVAEGVLWRAALSDHG